MFYFWLSQHNISDLNKFSNKE